MTDKTPNGPPKPSINAPAVGALLVVVGTSTMACIGLMVQMAGSHASDAMIIFACYALGGVVLVPIAWWRGELFVAGPDLRYQLVRMVASVAQISLFFMALRTLPLVDAALLRAAAPVWIPILLRVFWKQPMPNGAWPFIIAGFVGITLVLQPFWVPLSIGYAMAVVSGIGFAIQTIMNRQIDRVGGSVLRTTTLSLALGACVVAVPAAIDWQTPPINTLLILVAIGLAAIVGTSLLIYGFHFAQAHVLAPFLYFSVVVSALLDWIVFDRVPNALTALGCVIVVLACILLARSSTTAAHHHH